MHVPTCRQAGLFLCAAALLASPVGCRKKPAEDPAVVITGELSTPLELTGSADELTPTRARFDVPGCTGHIPDEPQHLLRITAPTTMRIVARSSEDLVMAIDGPGGPRCNDDFEQLHPGFQDTFEPGEYLVYVGRWRPTEVEERSYTLTIGPPQEDAAANPAIQVLDPIEQERINAVLAQQREREAAGPQRPVDHTMGHREGAMQRGPGSPPTSTVVVAGGSTPASATRQDCPGFVNPDGPSVVLNYTGGEATIVIRAMSEQDTTLLVRDPAGNILCNDDFEGELSAGIVVEDPAEGAWQIWAGTWQGGVAPATIDISER